MDCFKEESMTCRVFQFAFADFGEVLETMLNKLESMKQSDNESQQQFMDRQSNTRSICQLMTMILEKWKCEPPEEVMCIKITKEENWSANGSICFHAQKTKEYQRCCCYHCETMNNEKSEVDCACDDGPVYNREQCMDCPKRHFCDVTKLPQNYINTDE